MLTLIQKGSFIARVGGTPGHFVIVDKVRDEVIFIRDPGDGSSYNTVVADFLELFSGAVWK